MSSDEQLTVLAPGGWRSSQRSDRKEAAAPVSLLVSHPDPFPLSATPRTRGTFAGADGRPSERLRCENRGGPIPFRPNGFGYRHPAGSTVPRRAETWRALVRTVRGPGRIIPNVPRRGRMRSWDLADRMFWIPTDTEIREGATTDEYFRNTREVLAKNRIDSPVVVEAYAPALPYTENWAVVAGTYEVAKLLEDRPVDLWAMREGEIFLSDGSHAIYEPVLRIEGRYRDFGEYETAILGFLSSFSSVTTRAARFRLAAGDRLLFSFGTRRAHPALAGAIERGCYLGGFDGVSNVAGARMLGVRAAGTMPHALVQVLGEPERAWRLFDASVDPAVPRVAIADTFSDEKAEALRAWEVLGSRLWGVRLDTPSSRRGDFRKIIEEVRWELDLRGGRKVRILASGRLDETEVARLRDLVAGFGVGTAVAYPPLIDFSAKVVEVRSADGGTSFRGKRGGLGGRKEVYRSRGAIADVVQAAGRRPPRGTAPLLRPLLRQGTFVRRYEGLETIRSRVREGLRRLRRGTPSLGWR